MPFGSGIDSEVVDHPLITRPWGDRSPQGRVIKAAKTKTSRMMELLKKAALDSIGRWESPLLKHRE